VPPVAPDTPVTGYSLYVNDLGVGDWVLAYRGEGYPTRQTYSVTGLEEGQAYRFKASAHNLVGGGANSSETIVTASDYPAGPSQPQLVSSTASEVVIAWEPPLDNGGQSVASYEVYHKLASEPEEAWGLAATILATAPLTFTHTGLSAAADVQYKVRAQSAKGPGPFSVRNTFVLASRPAVPAAPSRLASTRNSLTVGWPQGSDGGSPISGYRLYQVTVRTGAESLAYDGARIPTVTSTLVGDLEEGEYYRFRVAAINRVGEGEKSPLSGAFVAGQVPGRGATPSFRAASSSSITFAFEPTADNGGSAVLQYVLRGALATVDGAAPETYAEVASYDGQTMDFVLGAAAEATAGGLSLSAGELYRFKFSALNSLGEGEVSPLLTVALVDPAPVPARPTLDAALGTKTSLLVRWAAVVPADGRPVDGYKLYMTELGTGTATCVYDGAGHRERLFYNATGLTTGGRYSFTVVSVNPNGVSGPSPELLAVVCLPPSHFPRPVRLDSTRTSVTLGWAAPSDDGGCPLLRYRLFVDDGAGGSLQEADAPAFEGRPYLTEHEVTNQATSDPDTQGAALVTGLPYRFKLAAWNEVGSVDSANYAEIVAASVPLAPASPPGQDFALTDAGVIRVQYASLDGGAGPATPDGGSPILGYDLWRDDGAGGDLVSLYGAQVASHPVLALAYSDFEVEAGTTYRYQYRARNVNGWGDFSGVAYLFAAARPSAPPTPGLLSVADDAIALTLSAPDDTGGALLSEYELSRDGGALNSAFQAVSTYNGAGLALTHTLTASADSLTTGATYSFRFRASNAVGDSPYSGILRVGLGAEPAAVTGLAADLAATGPTFLAMTWPAVTTGAGGAALALPVQGYVVQMIDPLTDEWADVLDASQDADTLSYVHYGAVTGETYTFRVFAVNFNGRSSQPGGTVAILACGLPRLLDIPVRVTSTRASITLRWEPPLEDGGCPVQDYAVYRDAGAGAPGTLVNQLARGDPGLLQFECTELPAGAAPGAEYQFRIEASNRQGSVLSGLSAPMLLAGAPAAPPAAPASDPLQTSAQQIKVTFGEVADDGGAPVLSYELQTASPLLDDWATLAGAEPHSLAREYRAARGIVAGQRYAFRYRAVNEVGAGPWSATAEIRAAGRPSAPP
jgi:titin